MGRRNLAGLVYMATRSGLYEPQFKDEEDVRKVLRDAGHVRFDPDYWEVYLADLARENCTRRAREEVSRLHKSVEFITDSPCPICQGRRTPASRADERRVGLPNHGARFGQVVMWHCENDRVEFSHFHRYGMFLLGQKIFGEGFTLEKMLAPFDIKEANNVEA